MNLEDVIDLKYGLQQDDYSLSGIVFGEEGQLEVVGWSGRNKSVSGGKYYILMCNKCNHDSELFGEGYFKSAKSHLLAGQVPCGCSERPAWSKDQYTILCTRKAKELGFKFLRFIGEWRCKDTKIKMLCEKHGEWDSGTVSTLIHKGRGCPGCRHQAIAEANTKPDDLMTDSFLASGAFHPDTKFWRSERKDNQGAKRYWYMSCPECGEIGESFSSSLQKGYCPCSCSKHRQQEAYINLIIDNHDVVVAIKFGVTNNSNRRVKQQSSKSAYTIEQHSVYTFPDVASCKRAESECKQEYETGVVLKRDMPDGYTETTWVYNLEKIEEIYKRNGGLLLSDEVDQSPL